MPEIVKLNRTCGHDHPHGQYHGISAKASSYYTPAFAAEVGRMLLDTIDEHNVASGHGAGQAATEECQIGPRMGERRTERAPHRPEEDTQ
eukprot:15469442-Heterocapsa_arctica.AAC.1